MIYTSLAFHLWICVPLGMHEVPPVQNPCQESYVEVYKTMVKNNIPIAGNGILSQCVSGLIAPHVLESSPCPPSSSAVDQENQ